MKRQNILKKLSDNGVVAVVRGNSIDEGMSISKACIEGGVVSIEVTYTNPSATDIIKELKSQYNDPNIVIGAGSVLDSETAKIALLAGAEFIVSPTFNPDTAKLCNRYQIPYIPGCMTITEMVTAIEHGSDIVKLFPGNVFGPSFIKSAKAPLPQLNIMPSGGVDIDNVEEWFKNGACAVSVGGKLTSGTPEEITEKAKKFMEKFKKANERG
ncbi:MAG: 2-dehydro-3-deoxyphosphogluconate aldolase / (4S)-4-hydroxy-2-oxoglutarate aldolase [Fusobacteriaceae bacterium]|jgi:2-dehydro-3-deoxyphosphogluconate aldolase/(4S)-4-hydroxy-2-oxoglutarate aldolase|nr:2-keto-3-deoxy-phosphogluconate aldolase [Fusobacteriales bacterium]MDN5304859.1 2-dehydro-3-deoxyphosphogluconate aldolase / (4S)-4-hydroxy-2-oxoglutarate aldolase [Fusobacteriaceae bacterium]